MLYDERQMTYIHSLYAIATYTSQCHSFFLLANAFCLPILMLFSTAQSAMYLTSAVLLALSSAMYLTSAVLLALSYASCPCPCPSADNMWSNIVQYPP